MFKFRVSVFYHKFFLTYSSVLIHRKKLILYMRNTAFCTVFLEERKQEKNHIFLTFCLFVDFPCFIQGEKFVYTAVFSPTLIFRMEMKTERKGYFFYWKSRQKRNGKRCSRQKMKTERKDYFCFFRWKSSKNGMERGRIIKWFIVLL